MNVALLYRLLYGYLLETKMWTFEPLRPSIEGHTSNYCQVMSLFLHTKLV